MDDDFQPILVEMLTAALPLWWADLQGMTCAELCQRAKELSWRFDGGDEERGAVGGEGMATGHCSGSSEQFNALAEMLACITMNEVAQKKPRPVRLFGVSWEYAGPVPERGGDGIEPVGYERYDRALADEQISEDSR